MILMLAVSVAAALGAPARYLLDKAIVGRRASVLPTGTMAINVTGAFVLGLLTGLALHDGMPKNVVTIAGTGFCGAYTTFSTFSHDTMRLVEDGSIIEASWNVAISLAAGMAAAAAGLGLALMV
ncbi:fluoride efflux transporter CrcB [Catenulispora pinisilvae]|uniref:fluoride efflux transporter CrcB n=2 Tax=Catenulispora pinisilvae TaxID=2705253 RepID=UPI001890F20D|nr:fluoride efflux transporter CrcB [Catenulispora pinisilvae]